MIFAMANGEKMSFAACRKCGGTGVHLAGLDLSGKHVKVTRPTCADCREPLQALVNGRPISEVPTP